MPGTIANPLGSLIEGLLQGHQLGMQIHQQQQADQQFKTQQILENQKISAQELLNQQSDLEHSRPVNNGTVQDRMNAMIPGAPATSGAPAPAASPDQQPDLTNLPTNAGPAIPQQFDYMRKADASRVYTRTAPDGTKITRELYTPEEQNQRAVQKQIANNNALTEAANAEDLRKQQAIRQSTLKLEGGGFPAQGLSSVGVPDGTRLTRAEAVAMTEAAQKIRDTNMKKLTPGETLVDVGGGAPGAATGTASAPGAAPSAPRVIASGGPPLPTDDFGKYFLPKYLLKIGKTADNATVDDISGAQSAYEKAKKSIPTTPTELAIAATDPTKTPEERDMANRALKRIQADRVNVTVQTQAARTEAGGLTDDDYARAGEQYARTGVMPAMGRDSATRSRIVHSANEWARDNGYKPADLVTMQAAYQGDKESLKKFQTQRDQIVSFEQTAQKNLDNFIGLAGKIVDTGSPWLNLPMRKLSDKLVGSTNMAAVNAARQIASNEIAKVTSGGGLSGVLSDAARKEVEKYNPADATLAQTLAVAKVLRTDMQNRHQSMDSTLGDIKTRIGGGQNAPAAETPQIPAAAPALPATLSAADKGKIYTNRAGQRIKITEVNPANAKQFKFEVQP